MIIETSTGRLVQGCNYSVIPSEGVNAIGKSSFEGFDSLTIVRLPDCISQIEDDAFANCSNLEIVYMGAGINRIGERVFSECGKLADVFIDACTPPFMPQGSIPDGCTIHVKESALSDYKADDVWSAYEIVADNDPTVVPFSVEDAYDNPRYYDLQGREAKPGSKGLMIDAKGTVLFVP